MKEFTISKLGEIGEVYETVSINGYISELTAKGDEDMQVSDGFHTMDELYEHRITLWIALCRISDRQDKAIMPSGTGFVWRSKKHSDGEMAFGGTWFVLGIGQAEGHQMTYHLPIEKWDECSFAEELEKAPEWDGHTSADVLKRIKNL